MLDPSPQPPTPTLPSDPPGAACSFHPPRACNQFLRTEPRPAAGAGAGFCPPGPQPMLHHVSPPSASPEASNVAPRGFPSPSPSHIPAQLIHSPKFLITQVQQHTILSTELYSFNECSKSPLCQSQPSPLGASRSEETYLDRDPSLPVRGKYRVGEEWWSMPQGRLPRGDSWGFER